MGETFVFAAGDNGGVAEYPSASPNVLSVGGTTLYVDAAGVWQGETAWSDGGGGQSKYEGVPSYQSGLGLTSRGTPDVAYDGNPETGFAVYDSYGSGGWAQFGGTSAGTPQWAALLAIANQGRALAGKDSLANAQAVLYAMPSTDFHDIQYGGNGNPTAIGYDLATGLGSPIADRLIPDLVAYNGSTSFTVANLAATNPPRSQRQFALSRGAVALLDNGYRSDPFASVVDRMRKLNQVASESPATTTTASSLHARPSGLLALGESTQTKSTDAAISKLRRRSDGEASMPKSSYDSPLCTGASLEASVDAYFASIGAAA